MGIKVANNAFGTLASSITNSATSITLTTGQGARFPTLSAGDYFYATLIDTSNNLEIVKCTARSTDVLTVTRAQENTTARAYSAGDRIEIRITAATFEEATAIADGEVTAAKLAAGAAVSNIGYSPTNGTFFNNDNKPTNGFNGLTSGSYVGVLDGYSAPVPGVPDTVSWAAPFVHAGTTNRGMQIATPYENSRLYWRNSNDSGWRGWKRVVNYDEDATLNSATLAKDLSTGAGTVSPMFWINRGSNTNDLAQGDYLNLLEASAPSSYQSWHQAQFSPFASAESMTWDYLRLIFRMTGNNSSDHTDRVVTWVTAKYYYTGGWSEVGSSIDTNGTDGARGFRWVVMPWISQSTFGSDVPGLGLRLKTASINCRVGSVYIQYKKG